MLRVKRLRVENYRALCAVELRALTPLTVLVGPNDSGKSTILDVFSFLAESFQFSLRFAWDKRGHGRELKTRGQTGPVALEFDYVESSHSSVMTTYRLAIDERRGQPTVTEERLIVRAGPDAEPLAILDYRNGSGSVIKDMAGGTPTDRRELYAEQTLNAPDLIAVNALGQFAEHPRIAALRAFIAGWHVSSLSIEAMRSNPLAGPQERLTQTGDNLANVIAFLREAEPDRLAAIFHLLSQRVPHLESVLADELADGRLSLQIKDAPFSDPILARFASDGTLKLLAYLVLLHAPGAPQFIGIEEPENHLHQRLMYSLAEEFRSATGRSQLLVTTHSPYFLDALRPEEVRVLYRDEQGHTQSARAAEIVGLPEFVEHGGQLGDLWMEGHFNVGDPLTRHGLPRLVASR